MGAVVDDGTEHLAAGAIGDGVVDHQRGVAVLGALEQVDAVDVELGTLAVIVTRPEKRLTAPPLVMLNRLYFALAPTVNIPDAMLAASRASAISRT